MDQQHSRRTVLRVGAWSTPAVLLANAAPAVAASGSPTLTLSGVATFASKVATPDSSTSGVWEFTFSQVEIGAVGGAVAAGGLTLTTTFVPDAGYAGHDQLSHLAGGPAGWTSYAAAGSGPSVAYTSLLGVGAGSSVTVPDGTWISSADPSDQQHGNLVLTATAPGFQPAVWMLHVPYSGDMSFLYGQSQGTVAGNPLLACVNFAFPGLQLKAGGPTIPNTQLVMTTTFEPDATATGGNQIFNAAVGGNFSSPLNSPSSVLYWQSLRTFNAGAFIAVAGSGIYIVATNAVSTQHGTFVVRFSAPGYNQTVWRQHVP